MTTDLTKTVFKSACLDGKDGLLMFRYPAYSLEQLLTVVNASAFIRAEVLVDGDTWVELLVGTHGLLTIEMADADAK